MKQHIAFIVWNVVPLGLWFCCYEVAHCFYHLECGDMWYRWVCSSAVMKQHIAFIVWNVVTCGTIRFVVLLL